MVMACAGTVFRWPVMRVFGGWEVSAAADAAARPRGAGEHRAAHRRAPLAAVVAVRTFAGCGRRLASAANTATSCKRKYKLVHLRRNLQVIVR